MYRGRIDAVTLSGFVVGWAYNTDAPTSPSLMGVFDENSSMLAYGLTHHFRDDLATNGCGIGWCAFRLRVTRSISRRRLTLVLVDLVTKQEVHHSADTPIIADDSDAITSVQELIMQDPTKMSDVSQLSGCRSLFTAYIARNGVDQFVRAAYFHVLGRPADRAGTKHYSDLLRAGQITPIALLGALVDSEEYRKLPRLMSSPSSPEFIFRED